MPDLTPQAGTANRSQVFRKLTCLIQAIPAANTTNELTEQTPIAELSMDSLRLIEIIFELERHFDCAADEGLMAEARTLGDVVSLFSQTDKESATSV